MRESNPQATAQFPWRRNGESSACAFSMFPTKLYLTHTFMCGHTNRLIENMTLIKSTRNATNHHYHQQNFLYRYIHACLSLSSLTNAFISQKRRSADVSFVKICSIKAKADSVDHQLRYDIPANCFSFKQ